MNITTTTNRRTFLRNGSKALTLPFLASLLPAGSRALAEKSLASNTPKRLLWMSMGHGHMEKHFYPKKGGNGNIHHQSALALYNGMISPLKPYGIRGAIWYQGESNNGEGMLYYEKKKALVNGWRKVWKISIQN